MSNEDGTLWIVFNGEIYNHRELRRELKSRGHTYKTHSDTETVIHAYEEFGEACVEKFLGMFALRFGTSKKNTCLLRGTGWESSRFITRAGTASYCLRQRSNHSLRAE